MSTWLNDMCFIQNHETQSYVYFPKQVYFPKKMTYIFPKFIGGYHMNKLFITLSALAILAFSPAHARPSGTQKLIYVCGRELTPALLEGRDWETIVGYYTGDKNQVFLAAGWLGFFEASEISENSPTRAIIEGPYLDVYRRIIVSKETTLTKIGDKKYSVAKAENHLFVSGADLKRPLFCIYYPENDVFFK